MLLAGFGIWSLATGLSMVLGGAHVLEASWLVLVGLTLAVVWRMRAEDGLVEAVRDACLLLAAASLALLLAAPGLVAQTGYAGLLPIRLAGVANHANSLAPLMLIGMVALQLAPYGQRWCSCLGGLLLLSCLALSQSKTTFAIGALAASAGLLQSLRGILHRQGLPADGLLAVGAALLLALLTTALALAIAGGVWIDPERAWQGLVGDFTGREIIWDWSAAVWRRHPWFGIGFGSLWSPSMREDFFAIGAWRPGYSHSLYYQTLGESGLVGMAGVIGLALTMLRSAWTARHGGALVVLVAGLVLARGITEVTWGTVVYSENALLVLFLIALLIADQPRRTAA